jgi:hypothetical protein
MKGMMGGVLFCPAVAELYIVHMRLSFIFIKCVWSFLSVMIFIFDFFSLGADEISISSIQLYYLLNENKTNILILDSRHATCYAESHMTIGNCINVPEEIVKPG